MLVIPSSEQVRQLLKQFRRKELHLIAGQCDVSFYGLQKIRLGIVKDPGIDTVRQIYHAPMVAEKIAALEAA